GGGDVCLGGRSVSGMEASKKRIEQAGGRAVVVDFDVRDVKQVQGLVDRAVRETGRLDIMVNNAGVSYPTPIVDGDPEEWRAMLETEGLPLPGGGPAPLRAMGARTGGGRIADVPPLPAPPGGARVARGTKHPVA